MAPHDPERTADHPATPSSHTLGPGAGTGAGGIAAPAGYELLDEIGRGGMGVVYRARDTALGRDVGVKVLAEKFAPDSGTARRFLAEARITGQLQHPGIPAVHQVGTLPDGRPFLAMKLIKGHTLEALLRERPDASADRGLFLAVFEQVAQAVAYAHAHQVIHRDLKPANVMVGAFGEVQVMDWGLAKVLASGRREPADEPALETVGTAIDSDRDDGSETRAGSMLGTPAYMPLEQAIGAIDQIDRRSDVFGLGAILCTILTGAPPYVGANSEAVRQLAMRAKLDDAQARLNACRAEPELIALAKRCLATEPDDRPADADEVARAVAGLRAAAEQRARRAELDRAKAAVQAAEQRKRRRVQLVALGSLVALVLAVAGAALMVQRQRETERLRGQVAALASADTAAVPALVAGLADRRAEVEPLVRERLASAPAGSKEQLHYALALLPWDGAVADRLRERLLTAEPAAVPVLVEALRPHAGPFLPDLWVVSDDAQTDPGRRLRAAALLAAVAPDDARWATLAPGLAELLAGMNPLEALVWAKTLEPAGAALVPPLLERYPRAGRALESGKLAVADLAKEATAFDLMANLLARYAVNQPTALAELAMTAETRHYALFDAAIRAHRSKVVPLLQAELLPAGSHDWTCRTGYGAVLPGVSALARVPLVMTLSLPDALYEVQARRQAHAAATLLKLGEAEAVWPLLRHSPDPSVRSYLVWRLAGIGLEPLTLLRRFEADPDVTAKRALLIALGEYEPGAVPAAERAALTGRLLALYRDDPDPGLHGAIDWLLRQRWGRAAELARMDSELAKQPRRTRNWFVNGEGQTFAVVRGPVEFVLGSPPGEPGRNDVNEEPHRKVIPRTFAIATKEVTTEQFLRFRRGHIWAKRYGPDADGPALSLGWYDAAAYCNWLSGREGIPESQWCYEKARGGEYAEGMKMKPGHLALTGYRLPTEAEWESACRAGATTARYFGRAEDLLPRYAWYLKNGEDRAWPVGSLRPNDLGLFDILGNVWEWTEDPALSYDATQTNDVELKQHLLLDERKSRLLRGGSLRNVPAIVRSAHRNGNRPGEHNVTNGFRPVVTLPSYDFPY